MKKTIGFFFIIFFGSSSFSYSLDEFLNWSRIAHPEEIKCQTQKDDFYKVDLSSIISDDDLEDYDLVEKIIDKLCSKSVDTKLSLHENLKILFENLDKASERKFKIFLLYARDSLSPFVELNDAQEIVLTMQKVRFAVEDFLYLNSNL